MQPNKKDQQRKSRSSRGHYLRVSLACGFAIVLSCLLKGQYFIFPIAVSLAVVITGWCGYRILNGLFVLALRRPYEELAAARDELQAAYVESENQRREVRRSIGQIGAALSSSLRLDTALNEIAELAAGILHAECCIVASLVGAEGPGRVVAQTGCEGCSRPLDTALSLAGTARVDRRTVLIGDIDAHLVSDRQDCEFGYERLRSMVCSPMTHGDSVLGIIAVFSRRVSAFDDDDAKLLEAFATHAAVAMRNAMRYERESHIADVLQRSFLSLATIQTDRFDIAQVYEPAMNEALVGGDFYDVVQVSDHNVALAIGDVSGKGLKAAVHAATVKYSLRAYLKEGHSPATVMKLLDAAISGLAEPDTFITMFFGMLNTQTGELVYVNAGHEPPVYACNGIHSSLAPTGPALGMGIDAEHSEDSLILEKGSVLLLYTDGISEARHGSAFMGTHRIGEELLVCNDLGSEDVARCVHQAALDFAGGELMDDAAILAVRAK